MAYCRQCGAPLQEGSKYCPACGAPADSAPVRVAPPPIEYPAEKTKKKRKSLFKRWWFWVLALLVIAGMAGRSGAKNLFKPAAGRTEPTAVSMPQTTPRPTLAPSAEATAAPTAEPTPAPQATASGNEIRPEVREFLDAYEACMDEYVDFMQRYTNADPASMVTMMGDYYSVLARYTEFAEKIDAFDESELNNAELAYYLEVTNRVNQKLLLAAG